VTTTQTEVINTLYTEHRGWLSVFIQRRMGCPEATADLIQDTYLRILTSGRLPEQKDARRYLTHIAKGLIIDVFRRRRVEEAYLDYLHQQPESTAHSVETQTLMIEALTEIEVLLHRLPKNVRQALLLRQLDGLSYKDIAKTMDVSVSSVEKYIAKGLQACLEVSISP
jgi:RNA polymerase sigma-70 factor (ECF subfamily)